MRKVGLYIINLIFLACMTIAVFWSLFLGIYIHGDEHLTAMDTFRIGWKPWLLFMTGFLGYKFTE
jgi:hypothetical protein